MRQPCEFNRLYSITLVWNTFLWSDLLWEECRTCGSTWPSGNQFLSDHWRLSNAKPGLYLDGWPVLRSCCRPSVEVLGKPLFIMPPLSTQQWWVSGGTRKLNCIDWLQLQQSAQMLNSLQRRWDYKREFRYLGCKLWSLLNSRGYQTINIHIYIHMSRAKAKITIKHYITVRKAEVEWKICFYTWPMVGIKPQTFKSGVQFSIHFEACSTQNIKIHDELPFFQYT